MLAIVEFVSSLLIMPSSLSQWWVAFHYLPFIAFSDIENCGRTKKIKTPGIIPSLYVAKGDSKEIKPEGSLLVFLIRNGNDREFVRFSVVAISCN